MRLVADLPAILRRMEVEKVLLSDLAREYQLSVKGVQKAIRLAGYTHKLGEARQHRRSRTVIAPKKQLRAARISYIRQALKSGRKRARIAEDLAMNLSNLLRLMREERIDAAGGP